MTITLFRNGEISANPVTLGCEKHSFVEIEGSTEALYAIIPLDDGIFVVREASEPDIQLIIFKQNKCLKPRVMKLHDIPAGHSIRNTIQSIFAALLSFDNNRLSNRDRNIAITIIRSLLPETVRGLIRRDNGNVNFHLYKDTLSVFSTEGTCLARMNYTTFSRTIKDRL